MKYFEIDLVRRITVAVEAQSKEEAYNKAVEECDDDWFGTWYENDTIVEHSCHITKEEMDKYGYQIKD